MEVGKKEASRNAKGEEVQQSRLERMIRGIEDRIGEWRQEDSSRKMEAEANRDALWAEAAEREKMLAESISEEEGRRESGEEVAGEQKLVFVVHTDEVAETLQGFADNGDRLVKVIPGEGSRVGNSGLSGSWLVFESPGD